MNVVKKDSRSKHPSERESAICSLKTSTSHILYHLGYYIITKDTVRNLNQRKWKRYCVCKLQRTRKQKRDFLLGMMIYRAMWRQCSHMLITMHTKIANTHGTEAAEAKRINISKGYIAFPDFNKKLKEVPECLYQ